MGKASIATSLDGDVVRTQLQALLGEEAVSTSADDLASHAVDGLTPSAVVSPRDEAQLAAVLNWANTSGAAVTPWGAGTKQNQGKPLARLDCVLRTGALDSILEIDEGNLTAEVEAGLSIGRLQAELRSRRLMFALDPLEGENATIGGILATNASGPRRLLYRTARDQVLGVRLVLPTGEPMNAGGKAVKDVAGYNLTKIMFGGLGTLGVITRAMLRLQPLPESSAVVVARFRDVASAVAYALKVRGSELIPAAIELCSDSAWNAPEAAGGHPSPTGPVRLLFLIEAHAEAVARMVRQIAAGARSADAEEVSEHTGDEAAQVWARRAAIAASLEKAEGPAARVKVSLPLSSLSPLLAFVQSMDAVTAFACHAGNGICQVYLAAPDGKDEAVLGEAFRRIREYVSGSGGFAILERAPIGLRRGVDVLPQRDDYTLMRRIRESINPNDIINPGKLF